MNRARGANLVMWSSYALKQDINFWKLGGQPLSSSFPPPMSALNKIVEEHRIQKSNKKNSK